jgi:thiol:disulfide interchange protein
MKLQSLLMCACLTLLAGCEVRDEYPQARHGKAAAGSHVARGQLEFIDGFERGYAEAQRLGKPMMLFFTAEWCHFCHQMADDAFVNPQVVSLSNRFVCVLIDADREADVCRQYRVMAFPTIQFTGVDGLPLNRIEGKRPGHQVMMAMQAALQTVARHESPLRTQR